MAVTFYHVRWCPECAVVRDKLETLHVPYDEVIVPDARAHRTQVFEVSGQYYVPVLKDADLVLTETWEILDHLETHYGRQESGEGRGGASRPGPTNEKTAATAELGEDDQFPSCQR